MADREGAQPEGEGACAVGGGRAESGLTSQHESRSTAADGSSRGAATTVTAPASKRHNRLARILANALDAAGGAEWNADTGFDVRLQDVPLTNRRPDVVVYRADSIDITPTRPEHVLLTVEIVSSGSETTDRVVKFDQYARSGIPW